MSRLSDGCVIDVNEKWVSLTGHEIGETVGSRLADINVLEDPGRFAEIRKHLADGASVQDEEMELRTRSGERRTVLLSAQQIDVEGEACALTVMTDITERNRALSALRASEERFHMLADSAPVLIWLADETGTAEHFNKFWVDYTGSPLEEHLSGGWERFVHADDRDACKGALLDAIDRQEAFTREYRLRRHNGQYRWVLDRAIPRFDSEGTFAGFIGSCVDIQEEKERQLALIEAKEHAEEMSKLKVMLLTNITHEIRTPLTVILGFTSILRQGVRTEYQRFVNLIERSGRRLLLMLDSMLDLAQIESGTLEIDFRAHHVGHIVDSVAALVRPAAEEKGVDLVVSLSQERYCARVDHGVLTRVVNNILDNAVKFTDQGHVDVSVRRHGSEIHIVIEDTGIGIEPEFLPHVFDPFVQESTGLDRTHQGSGLGLAVSKRLVELMDGTITLSSEKHRGSVFTIVLPASD
ncbi:MAG: PAS domain-containing sensor histidine kinase [Rhodothermales bacterium]